MTLDEFSDKFGPKTSLEMSGAVAVSIDRVTEGMAFERKIGFGLGWNAAIEEVLRLTQLDRNMVRKLKV